MWVRLGGWGGVGAGRAPLRPGATRRQSTARDPVKSQAARLLWQRATQQQARGPATTQPLFFCVEREKKNLDWQRWPASPVATRVAPSAPALSTNRRRWGYRRPRAGGARSRCPNATASCSPRPPSAAAAVVWPLLLPPARAGARGGDRFDPPGKGRLGPHWRASRVAGGGGARRSQPHDPWQRGCGVGTPGSGDGRKKSGGEGRECRRGGRHGDHLGSERPRRPMPQTSCFSCYLFSTAVSAWVALTPRASRPLPSPIRFPSTSDRCPNHAHHFRVAVDRRTCTPGARNVDVGAAPTVELRASAQTAMGMAQTRRQQQNRESGKRGRETERKTRALPPSLPSPSHAAIILPSLCQASRSCPSLQPANHRWRFAGDAALPAGATGRGWTEPAPAAARRRPSTATHWRAGPEMQCAAARSQPPPPPAGRRRAHSGPRGRGRIARPARARGGCARAPRAAFTTPPHTTFSE